MCFKERFLVLVVWIGILHRDFFAVGVTRNLYPKVSLRYAAKFFSYSIPIPPTTRTTALKPETEGILALHLGIEPTPSRHDFVSGAFLGDGTHTVHTPFLQARTHDAYLIYVYV